MPRTFHRAPTMSTADAPRLSQVPAPILAEMLDLETSSAGQWRPEELGQLLRDRLAAPLPTRFVHRGIRGESSGNGGDEAAVEGAARTFGELLGDPCPPADALRRVTGFAESSRL